MGFNANNMCDRGIEDTMDRIRDAVKDLVAEAFQNIEDTPDVKVVDGESTVEDWNTIPDEVVDHVCDNISDALEGVVQDIDGHMETVKEEAISSWLEYQEDYVHVDSIKDSYPFEDMVKEKDDKIEKLEERIEELEENFSPKVSYQGLTLTYVPGREKFICTQTGRVFELKETEDCSISMMQ